MDGCRGFRTVIYRDIPRFNDGCIYFSWPCLFRKKSRRGPFELRRRARKECALVCVRDHVPGFKGDVGEEMGER